MENSSGEVTAFIRMLNIIVVGLLAEYAPDILYGLGFVSIIVLIWVFLFSRCGILRH